MFEEFRVPLATTSGALLGLGCVVLWYALGHRDPATVTGATPTRRRLQARTTRRRGRQLLLGVLAGVVVLVVTRWVVLAVVLGGLIAFWDRAFGGARHERAAITRIEGLAG